MMDQAVLHRTAHGRRNWVTCARCPIGVAIPAQNVSLVSGRTTSQKKMPAWDKFAWFWRLRSRHACRRALDHRPHPPVHVPPIQQI